VGLLVIEFSSDLLTKVEVSQSTSSWVTVKEMAYTDGNLPEQPTTIKRYENDNGTGLLQTDYEYCGPNFSGEGKVRKITYPQVNHNYEEAGGSAYRVTREYTYDSLGRVSTVTDEDGMVTKYVYADDDDVDNDSDDTTDETDEWGGQVVKVIKDYGAGDLNLTVVEYEYDDDRLAMTKEKDALGNTAVYGYWDDGRLKQTFRPGGLFVKWFYDKNGNMIREVKKTSGAGEFLVETKSYYDKWGNVTEARRWHGSGAGDYSKTEYTYDSLGRLERTEFYRDQAQSFAAVEETTYVTVTSLPKQRKKGSTDGTNDTLVTRTSYKYDLMNRKIEEKDEVNDVTTTYTYNWRGFNRTISGPEGYFLKLWYDNLGRVTGTKRYDTDENGTLFSHTIRYFDEMGRVYRETTMNPGDTESSVTKH